MSDLEGMGFAGIDQSGTLGSAPEKTAEQQEQQREAFAKASAALAAARKDEQKTKKREKSLAALLSAFIREKGDHVDPRVLNTLVELLKQNIPSEFLVGVLALLYPTLREVLIDTVETQVVATQYQENARMLTLLHSPKALIDRGREFHHEDLPQEVKGEINVWVQVLMMSVSFHPDWILPKVYSGRVVHTSCVQLATFILEQFLDLYKIRGDFVQIRSFAQYIMNGVLAKMADKHQVSLAPVATSRED